MNSDSIFIQIVRLSKSFSGIWSELAEAAGAGVQSVEPGTALRADERVAALVLSAAGAENEALDWLNRYEVPGVPVLVVGADPGHRIAVQIVARGADDYFVLPADVEVLRNAVAEAVRRGREASRGRAEPPDWGSDAFARIIGESPALTPVLERAARIAAFPDATALIAGETGTGKELLAKAIHAASPRRKMPFVALNCSVLPQHLMESELFGHERGAFTDAREAKPGLLEVADGGTLFLDEITTLSIELQPKLLRILEDRQVRRVGGTKTRSVDIRIIAATNYNPAEAVADRNLREDLYHRLSVVRLHLPPLRERGKDSVLIAKSLLAQSAHDHNLPLPALTREAQRTIQQHTWPGNVRELRNAIERALLLSPRGELRASELLAEHEPATAAVVTKATRLDEIMAEAARSTLALCGGNRSEAARRLGISRRRLRRLLTAGRAPSEDITTR